MQKKARGRTYLIEEIFIKRKNSKVVRERFLRFFLAVFLSHPCSVVEVLSVQLCRFGYRKYSFYHHYSLSIYYCRFGFIYLLSLFFLSSLFQLAQNNLEFSRMFLTQNILECSQIFYNVLECSRIFQNVLGCSREFTIINILQEVEIYHLISSQLS